MKIGYVSSRDGGVDYHRLIRPFGSLANNGAEVVRYNAIPLVNVPDVECGIVVFNRLLWEDQAAVIAALKARGIRVVCDVDDYWILPSTHILYREHRGITPKIIEAVTLADEVWVTHSQLAIRARLLNPNVVVVPNAIEFSDPQWSKVEPMPDEPTLTYVAGATHLPDIAVTRGAWKAWKGKLHLCGLSDDNGLIFAQMADIMGDRGRNPIGIAKAMDVWNYGTFYDQSTIAIAPLADTAFNRCKSNLKILEAGAKGRPILVQDMHPYTPFAADGVIPVKDWGNALKHANGLPFAELGLSLRSHIEQHYSMSEINQIRTDAIDRLSK